VYVTKDQFDQVAIPRNHRRFVIIRDLRDTLISFYFSIKISHGIANESHYMSKARDWLRARDQEVGLLAMLEHWLPVCAAIRETWLHAGEPLLR
jgi:lipopolysaccharide transport system ATP-binding protein